MVAYAKQAREDKNATELALVNNVFNTYFTDDINRDIVNTYKMELDSIIEAERVKFCNISGVVTYYFNDNFGYRSDVGAKVLVVKATKNNSNLLKYDVYKQYSMDAPDAMSYYITYEKQKGWFSEQKIREKMNFSQDDEVKFKALADRVGNLNLNILATMEANKVYYETTVDGSGRYSLKLPYGDYFLIITSKNRTRPFIPEIINRVHIEQIKVTQSELIKGYDFYL
ncbi:MAG: hypothetical protein SNI58_08685 [Rikenellaceae bacterium]